VNSLRQPITGHGPDPAPASGACPQYLLAPRSGQQYPSTNPRLFIAFRISRWTRFWAARL